ncbi:T9SS type B sorting domain-containing protein [Lacinutrix sp. MEBiC02404]
MKKVTLLFLLAALHTFAQVPNIAWSKNYGGTQADLGKKIIQTTDLGYLVAGDTYSNDGDVTSNNGGYDVFLLKLNPDGDIIWKKTYGGSLNDNVSWVDQTSDGGYIISATSYSNDFDVSVNKGSADYWIFKIDSLGNLQWEKTFGGTGYDFCRKVEETFDGNFIVTGYSNSNDGDVTGAHGNYDFWVLKLNASGNIMWKNAIGGSDIDISTSIVETTDNGYLVSGKSDSSDGDRLPLQGISNGSWVVKLDINGVITWKQSWNNNIFSTVEGVNVINTNDNGFLVSSSQSSTNGIVNGTLTSYYPDSYITKLDVNGSIEWQKPFGGLHDELLFSMSQDADNGYTLIHFSNSNDQYVSNHNGNAGLSGDSSDAWIVKTDSLGNIIWESSFGGTNKDGGYNIVQTNDGGHVFTGLSESTNGDIANPKGDQDLWVLKLEAICPAPVVTSFFPSSGPEDTLVYISGSDFTTAATVAFDGISTTFTIINDNEIEAFIPAGISASSNITITSTGGCVGNSATDFTLLASECTTADVYISEIYDAFSGSYAVIELYNPTNTPIVLDGVYIIERFGDIGNAAPSQTYNVLGTIPPLDTFIIILGSGSDCPSLTADFNVGTGINENDEFKLFKNGTLIDIVNAPADKGYTIIRNPDAAVTQTTYTASDWSINSNEDCSDLGSHTADPIPNNTPTITNPTSQTICENGTATFTISISGTETYTYQWKVLNSAGNWVNVVNDANYSGATTDTLTITNAPLTFDANQYYCEVNSTSCDLVTNAAQLHVGNVEVDTLSSETVCTSYTLPTLTNGNYYTATNGGGTQLNVGDMITTSQTIFIYNISGTPPNTCDNETSFTITVSGTPPVDTVSSETVCASYTLPSITNGNYYTATNGGGTQLNIGDNITATQTIFIYNQVGTAPNTCSNESNFTITVTGNPAVDTISSEAVCTSYTLPTLTNGNYYTATNGGGTQLNVGDMITTSQTIYIYNISGTPPNTCDNETNFTITVSGTPPVDTVSNETVCASYTLPSITNGNYYTATNGGGTQLNIGDNITATQTIFIYNQVGTAPDTCSNESNFTITVTGNPPVDTLSDQAVCTSYTLPILTNGNYFTASNGSGTPLNAGDMITTSQTIFIYNISGTAPNTCDNETTFDVTIYPATDFTLDASNITIIENTLTVSMTDTSINYIYAVDTGATQTNPTFTDLANGIHTLVVQDENGCVVKSIPFTIDSIQEINIPLFFTPNGDTFNDTWLITDTQNTIKEILIFNRYGKLLKQVSPSSKFWDGTYRGYNLETNDYWYLITLHSGEELKGHFTLKR